MTERQLLHNSIQCPDGTILVSRHRHNFVEQVQKDGRTYFVDGGLEYQRIGFSDKEYIDLSVYSDDLHSKIREHFEWGSRGKDGKQPLKYIKLRDIDEEHLVNLLVYSKEHCSSIIHKVFLDEFEYGVVKQFDK